MQNAVFHCTFKLKEDACVPDFLAAAEKLNNEYISKQPGYISWKQLVGGDVWADAITFETMDDLKKFEENSVNAGDLAQRFYSFIDLSSCKVNYFTVVRSY